MDITLTEADIKIIRATMDRLRNVDCGEGYGGGAMCCYPDCDCSSSEIIMLSVGYVEVFADNGSGKGECVGYGRVLWTEED